MISELTQDMLKLRLIGFALNGFDCRYTVRTLSKSTLKYRRMEDYKNGQEIYLPLSAETIKQLGEIWLDCFIIATGEYRLYRKFIKQYIP